MMTKRRTVNTQVMMKLSNASSAKPQSVTKADLEQTPQFDVWHSLLWQGWRSGCDDGISDVVGCEHGKSLKIKMYHHPLYMCCTLLYRCCTGDVQCCTVWQTFPRLLVDFLQTFGTLSADFPIGRLSVDCWKTFGRFLVDFWQAFCRLSADF